MTPARAARPADRPLALIPVRNEAANLPTVVAEMRRCRPDIDILVVDDRSDDETPDLLPRLGVRWLELSQHLGVGGAVRAGLRYARRMGYTVALRVDGDGQHRPDQIDRLLRPLRGDRVDAVQGSRRVGDVSYTSQSVRRLGQRLIGAMLSVEVGRRVSDPTSGFWAFGPRAIRVLADHHPVGYPEPELRLFLARNGLAVAEASVQMRGRLSGRSSLTLSRAGVAAAHVLLAMAVVPLRPAVESTAHD